MLGNLIPQNKNMWRFCLLHLMAFIFIVMFFDFTVGRILDHFYFQMKNGYQYRTTYAIEKTKADIIVFGSSRASHHYYPPIFEDHFKLSLYNAGRDGEESCLYHYAVLKGILKRYTPKIVILDVMQGELGNKLYTYDKLASLAPYYKTHPEMRSIIELRSSYEKLKMTSAIYPFNSTIMNILSGNLDVNVKKNENIKGYLPIPSKAIITTPINTEDQSKEYELDSIKVGILASFIKDCVHSNIKLYIVCSPYYKRSKGIDYTILEIKKIAMAFNVNFFDFSREGIFLSSPQFFRDIQHLNDSGARVFSKMLVDSIEHTN